ncbi:Ubiquitin-like modifier-activating enzyme atg7 [Fulvia fulva]|nr:Ubiquitin-like modifier-activating enzyme atg7 [Fulvia fulva]KAK4615121.1 Ubiquitin-like modifier-activating enzyme atg7 [Fulvia fulva]WPV19807.1 Ubiquitin-like modifier-activating enzyme atg7 [Fulvia fulva]WPV35258.1 Ubiquitin-like modifier-activating enzyme atg7 [Fulvia fulva]
MAQLMYAPWTSDVELAFYSALANIKINHDKLDSSARKVLGLYEINHKDAPERSTRMQIHGTALTTDEVQKGFFRAEGFIRNFNTIDEFRQVDKAAHIERAGRMIWDAIKDGTIYSCPSLLCSFSAVCFADLKKYKFTYHFAYPAIHSDPSWKLVVPNDNPQAAIRKLDPKETEMLVDAVQTWRYSVDSRQHGFFLAKRLRKEVLEAEWRAGRGEVEEEGEDGNLCTKPSRRKSRTSSLSEVGFLWWIGSLSSYENGFFDNARPEDRYVCFADPSTYSENPGWMLRNLLVLVRQRWHLDNVKIICYRDVHARREHPTSLLMDLQSAEPVYQIPQDQLDRAAQQSSLGTSTAFTPDQVDQFGELITDKLKGTDSLPLRPKTPPASATQFTKATGWERSDQGKVISRTVDLAAYLDPSRLADQAVDLNLKLIKWRIAPSIDLETIKHTKCLLLGAGTLGAYVARNLMGWGVKKITFVDDGRVSYSNPVRQPLYDFKDCQNGGVWKAQRASDVLSGIYPGVDSEGVVVSVPMAGHPIIGDETKVQRQFEQLKGLVDAHDAIFLLMDTREARWLPTVMGKSAGKIVINAALGFDTYMVMRHGQRAPPAPRPSVEESAEGTVLTHPKDEQNPLLAAASDPIVNGNGAKGEPEELGCYFCSDVVAPADSMKKATLDQQCTVTRPGAAPIASALAVELLVSITQHKLKGRAPAPPELKSVAIAQAPDTDPSLPNSHPLGTVPHQLRGYMSTWQTLQIRGQPYDCCAACSPKVLEAYERDGWSFLKHALNDKGYVEEISGLAEVQRQAEAAAQAMEAQEDDWPEEDEEGELI